ncbi:hypothetical protein BC834DRAFT_926115 [Gloeopeniophorella convolvens]|nr:hypothetical protein BC834DRAFT_926115 [Gloeopeniophorella convolvens]
MTPIFAFAFLAIELAGTCLASQSIVLPSISRAPSHASQVLDQSLASLSIELAFLTAFGGNNSNPNALTGELMQRIEERTGKGPDVRPGGITIDSSIFSPNAPALVLSESSAGGIYRSTFGPALYESLNVFPNSSKFVVDLNMGNNTISIARDELAAGIQYIGWDRIRALELGNEADHYAGGSRPSGWASSDYTAQFLGWTSAGSFADDPLPNAAMTTIDIINEGIDTTGVIKLFNQHMYQYSTCDPTRNSIATLAHLVNHTNITTYVDLWKPQIAAARERGKEFVVGEYNSVSCSGKENVTNTFGQALWLADTVLYGASVNISRMYLHQGGTLVLQSGNQANTPGFSWYDLWYPIPTDRYGTARASPSYVAYLFIAEAVGSSGVSQLAPVALPANPDLAVYAIWDSGLLTRLALINMAHRNVTTAPADADAVAVTVDLSSLGVGSGANVKRLTAPGMDSTDSTAATWAGQSYASGIAQGSEVIEKTSQGKVDIAGSEAVLVFL